MSAPAGPARHVLECVVNVSEGRDDAIGRLLARAAGPTLIDVHRDGDHHRSVLTLAGEATSVAAGARALAAEAVRALDLRVHRGAHPRVGVVDVVPWIDLVVDGDGLLAEGSRQAASDARDAFAEWAGRELDLPCFLYGPPPAPSLPEVRRHAWVDLAPATGPGHPHPTAGAACVGARGALVAYNLWLDGGDLRQAKRVAAAVRRPGLRTLGLQVGDRVQVSCNLVDPWVLGPADAYDAVAGLTAVGGAELVGLLPRRVLDAVPPARWPSLDLATDRTIEARLGRRASTGEALEPGPAAIREERPR